MADDLNLIYGLAYSPATSTMLKMKFEEKYAADQPEFLQRWSREYGSQSGVLW